MSFEWIQTDETISVVFHISVNLAQTSMIFNAPKTININVLHIKHVEIILTKSFKCLIFSSSLGKIVWISTKDH